MRCQKCREKFEVSYFLQKFCEVHEDCIKASNEYKNNKSRQNSDVKKKPINKVSIKRQKDKPIYETLRIEVLAEAKFKCFIEGCNNVANTCEHRMGRKGFADEWARENNISLYIDKRFLAACCSFHNTELENNPELSKKYQLSKIHGGSKNLK